MEQHSERKHALLSASGADRWMNCTPSARLEEKFEESTSSSYAMEGTLAHEIADVGLRFQSGQIDKSIFDKEMRKLRKQDLYGPEMEDETQKYIDIVLKDFKALQKNDPGAKLLVEERFDFSHLVEQGFGTGDGTLISAPLLIISDLKYGKGIRVDADDNSQLKLYALGALRKYELAFDIQMVRMQIIQPRLDHFSTFEMSVEDLLHWGSSQVRPKAAKAYQGLGVQKAGDWCKWCKVKAMCATLAARNIKLAQMEFEEPRLMKDHQILEVYGQLDMLLDWANAVKKHMLDEAQKGKQWKGYKLVEGRSNRKWTSEEEVKKVLEKKGYDETSYLIEKLANLTTIEKLVGKANMNDVLGKVIIKPPGAPTLVPNSDKRPAIGVEQAKIDFQDDFDF